LAAAAGAALLVVPLGVSARRAPVQDPPQPTFRSSASAIAVDVTVRDRSRRAITGLKAADFQVLDNGVAQKVDDVTFARLPIDVTVALDVSYSVSGALLARLRDGVAQLMRDLGPEDRLKLVLFNMDVTRAVDFTTDAKAVERAIRGAGAGGGTALLDALSVSLISASAPDRRQLIVVFTDGSDTSSTTTPAMLMAVAQRTRATLAFVIPGGGVMPTIDSTGRVRGPTGRGPVPARAGLYPLFLTLAGETGGSILPVNPATNLSTAFRNVLREFRSAYVLYYTARGVDPGGYHTIEVKVKREGAQVQARRSYFGS
jgi:VWFA-related protein